jgi:anti-sigma regulatory factor (Ser/Thr protein kinase)
MESLSLITDATFTYQNLQQAYDLGTMLANTCPDPTRTVVGLTELLVNAIEHGNLGITYEEKSKLNAVGNWSEEVDRRLADPENAEKRAVVRFERVGSEIHFTIKDEGKGFNWTPFLEVEPQRAFDTHGRGIAMANLLSFDRLEYIGSGNEVRATVKVGTTAGS